LRRFPHALGHRVAALTSWEAYVWLDDAACSELVKRSLAATRAIGSQLHDGSAEQSQGQPAIALEEGLDGRKKFGLGARRAKMRALAHSGASIAGDEAMDGELRVPPLRTSHGAPFSSVTVPSRARFNTPSSNLWRHSLSDADVRATLSQSGGRSRVNNLRRLRGGRCARRPQHLAAGKRALQPCQRHWQAVVGGQCPRHHRPPPPPYTRDEARHPAHHGEGASRRSVSGRFTERPLSVIRSGRTDRLPTPGRRRPWLLGQTSPSTAGNPAGRTVSARERSRARWWSCWFSNEFA
jgi:hypothetical protein